MTLKQIIAMVAGNLASRWVKDMMLQLGLAQMFAAAVGLAAGSLVTTAIATA